ncbi:MAG TPA: site-specific DNA-methyltransferase [Candidatus Eisenbacteria bacterium]|nr:site-specific DNA-methyltransferase [Candidatus Eisenbacteria bacterium]
MEPLTSADPETKSADILAENIARLKDLFPEAFTEEKVDFEVLKQLLGSAVDEREEKYGLNWHGKRRARRLALTPSTGTLRPCPEDSVAWDTTRNLVIEGDNLEVLKLMQKSYAGKVKLIYIDPPYNTGNDFVYPDDFHDSIRNYLELTGQVDGTGGKLTSNTEASGRFHTDWLNMMYPRLKLARTLLRDDGVIFISIDDAEVSDLRLLCSEIFGEENFLAVFVRRRRMATGMRDTPVSPDHEYIVSFAKSVPSVRLFGFARREDDFPLEDARGRYRSTDLTVGMTREMRPNQFYAIKNPKTGSEYLPPEERVWRFEPSTMREQINEGNIIWPDDNPGGRMSRPRFKTRFVEGSEKANPVSTWVDVKSRSHSTEGDDVISLRAGLNQEATKEMRDLLGEQVLEYPKPVSLLRGLCAVASKADDIVLDFFAGSGTTGHAVWDLNRQDGGTRRFILVQLPEVTRHKDYLTITPITKERLRRAGKKMREANPMFTGDLGFRVFKLASSNIRAWEPNRENLAETLEASVEHLKTDRTEHDILFELLLKLGLDLTVPIEEKSIGEKPVHSIGAGTLLVCLAPQIAREEIELLALGIADWYKALAPAGETTVVFRDSAFADDVAKTNLTAILQQHGLANVRSL